MDKYIKFNNDYVLKPDEGRVLIMAKLIGRNRLKGIDDSFTNIIHPIYAMILCFIDGREYHECINDAANGLGVSAELVERFVQKLINNPTQVNIKSKDKLSAFPPYTITTIPSRDQNIRYDPDLFSYSKLDLRMKRHLTPSSITLMVNNICATNCIYCYQDKRKVAKCEIPLSRIMELIHEAKDINVNTFDVIGGEFFLYKHWKEVLKELRLYGYNPYLSTKIPLQEEDIKFLSQIKVLDLQVSIDTFIKSHLASSIGVSDDYADRMLHSLDLLAKYNIPIKVHSVLTKYNDNIEDMQSVYSVLKNLPNLIDWHVVKGERTLYPKDDFRNIEIKPKSLDIIIDYLESLKDKSNISIHIPEKVSSNKNIEIKHEINYQAEFSNFFNRSFCSGLFSSLYILPDGQVTMCEQLYWNKDFIVGNILNSTILDVWNSDKAKSIFFIRQTDIPSDSLCHTCDKFEACRTVRQVCYREIIKKYGKDKWYYPDVNCPYAKYQK